MRSGERWAQRFAEGLTRALLLLYPPSFRRELGSSLLGDVVERAATRWQRGGVVGFALWWLRSAASLVINAFGAWIDGQRTARRSTHARSGSGEHATATGGRSQASLDALDASRSSPLHPGMASMMDVRTAFRSLRGAPLVSTVAILSLGLGMGANTAIFSIVDSLVLRPLPVHHADRLALLAGDDDQYTTWWSNPIWEAIRDRQGLFDGAFAYGETRFDLASGGRVDLVDGLRASGRMFDVLGVDAIVGRTFREADDRRGGGPDGAVAVISYGFWQHRFGGAPDVVGRTITLERVPFTIVGVTPASFFGPEVGRTFDVAVPIGALSLMGGSLLDSRTSWWLHVMVRLAPGQSVEQTTAALRAVQPRIADETRPAELRPQDAAAYLTTPFNLLPARTGTSELRSDYRHAVYTLMAIVALTLLIACGNIANLLLARTSARRHELGVRSALGASRWRLARQLFTESLLLSGLGAVLGVGFAFWGTRLVVSQLSTDANRVFLDIGIEWRMLAFTGGVAVGTALLFGIVPALRGARAAPIEAMKDHGRGTASRRRIGVTGSLVIAQVALSLVLLIGAVVFVRTFATLESRDLGFERDRALLVRIDSRRTGLDAAARDILYRRIHEEVLAIPGVSAAAVSFTMPLGDNTLIRLMEIPGHEDLPESERRILRNFISPGWFASMGIPLIAGRDFDGRDRIAGQRAVIVNRAFAQKYFPGENPVGRTITESAAPGADPTALEIVGVVGDAIYRSVRQASPPTMFWALAQMPAVPTNVTLVARASTGSPVLLASAIGDAVTALNQELALTFRPLADQVDASLTQERLLAQLSGFFGMLALLLASLGLYAITSYAVSQRRVELGIRIALGSSPAAVVRLVLARVAVLVGSGLLIGAVLSWWLSRFIDAQLYGVTPREPATILGAIVLLALVATLAGWLPARRSARIDPAVPFREA